MDTREKETKIQKIKSIMDLCCEESLSVAYYTIEMCKAEYDTDHLLLFVYNCKHEILEARLSNYDDMIEIAKKIRKKSKTHKFQRTAICDYVREKYESPCMVKVDNYRDDVLKLKLSINGKVETIQGTYSEIMGKLKNKQ